MKAIGIDMVETKRIAQSMARFGDRFLRRIYTEQELAYCRGKVTSLAGRWATKEATAKALGSGIGPVSWQEIEVVNQPSGQPTLRLHGAAKALADQQGITQLLVSLSHTKEYAMAFVVAE